MPEKKLYSAYRALLRSRFFGGGDPTQHPAERALRGFAGQHAAGDVERRALARPQAENPVGRSTGLREAFGLRLQARAFRADEDGEVLADQKALADVQQLGGGTVRFEDLAVTRRHQIRVGRRIEKLPVLLALDLERLTDRGQLAAARLQLLLRGAELLNGELQLLQRLLDDPRRIRREMLGPPLQRRQPLHRRRKLNLKRLNPHWTPSRLNCCCNRGL